MSELIENPGHVQTVEAQAMRPSATRASSWFRDVAISVGISLLIIFFLYQPVRVEGTSMAPNLSDSDRLVINRSAYAFHLGNVLSMKTGSVHRGDIVVFQFPRDHAKHYIKRVIGLPGDRIRIDRGKVFVNDEPLVETYVPRRYADTRSVSELTIPPHEFWVMGDHRVISSDSRDFGTVNESLIDGRASFVYWPMDQLGVVR